MKLIDELKEIQKDFDYFKYRKNDENDFSIFAFKGNSVSFFVCNASQKEIDELIEEGFFDEVQS